MCPGCSCGTEEWPLIRELRKAPWRKRYLRKILSSYLAGESRRASGRRLRGMKHPVHTAKYDQEKESVRVLSRIKATDVSRGTS